MNRETTGIRKRRIRGRETCVSGEVAGIFLFAGNINRIEDRMIRESRMAGMKRFVTYIYSYEDKKKGSNTGFAKIEVRGNDGRMEIHLRGAFPGRMKCKVYLFAEDSGDMVGVPLGEMSLQNGAGDFSTLFKVENIGGMPVNFFAMEGIILIGESQRIFLSRWAEGNPIEVCMERFRQWESPGEEQETPVNKTAASQNQSSVPEAEQVIEQSVTPQGEENRKRALPSEKEAADQTVSTQQPAARTDASHQGQSGSLEEAEEENIAATEIPMRNIFPRYNWQQIWENLKANHEKFVLYREEEICCVKIELKDIRELPRRYWYLGNNSFLLHGFFNYRYLVVGKLGEERWFIGVPGIYQNQERVMAAIFGFPEFLPEPVENHFGYWCRMIEE